MAFGKKSVECVTKLVEYGLNLVYGEKCRERVCCRSHVAYVYDNRSYVIAILVYILLSEVGHPGTASLGVSWEVVRHKDTQQRGVCIHYLKDFNLRVVKRNIADRFN